MTSILRTVSTIGVSVLTVFIVWTAFFDGKRHVLKWITHLLADFKPVPPPEGVRCERDIVYATTPETEGEDSLLLDLYTPDDGDGTNVNLNRPLLPVVIFLFGGSWVGGNKHQLQNWNIQDWLVKRGYAVVSCNYRLAPKHTFPAQLHDVKAVVKWIRANSAFYGLDPNAIGVWGPSAGGHLALLLAMTADSGDEKLEGRHKIIKRNDQIDTCGTGNEFVDTSSEEKKEDLPSNNKEVYYSTKIHACLDYMGPTKMMDQFKHSATTWCCEELLLGRKHSKTIGDEKLLDSVASLASPYGYLDMPLSSPSMMAVPPVMLVHSKDDTIVPFNQSLHFHEKMKSIGKQSSLKVLKKEGHGFGKYWNSVEAHDCVGEFFDKILKAKVSNPIIK